MIWYESEQADKIDILQLDMHIAILSCIVCNA